jgi:hypothetical protein
MAAPKSKSLTRWTTRAARDLYKGWSQGQAKKAGQCQQARPQPPHQTIYIALFVVPPTMKRNSSQFKGGGEA